MDRILFSRRGTAEHLGDQSGSVFLAQVSASRNSCSRCTAGHDRVETTCCSMPLSAAVWRVTQTARVTKDHPPSAGARRTEQDLAPNEEVRPDPATVTATSTTTRRGMFLDRLVWCQRPHMHHGNDAAPSLRRWWVGRPMVVVEPVRQAATMRCPGAPAVAAVPSSGCSRPAPGQSAAARCGRTQPCAAGFFAGALWWLSELPPSCCAGGAPTAVTRR